MIRPTGEKLEFWDYFPVLAATVIAAGDALWWDSATNSVKPASSFVWGGSAAATRKQFRRVFVGIAAEPHFASGPNLTVKVLQVCKANCDLASATPTLNNALFGLDTAASLLMNQQVVGVENPAEAIGEWGQYYSASVTQAIGYIRATFSGYLPRVSEAARTLDVALMTIPASGTTFMTALAAEFLFGGAAEVLSVTWIEQVAITTNPLVIRFTKNSAGTPVVFASDMTVPTAGAAIGRISTQDYSTEVGRFFEATDTFDMKVQATAPATGQGQFRIKFRPLS